MTNTDVAIPVRVIRALGTLRIAEVGQWARAAAEAGHCLVVAGIVPVIHFSPRQHQGWQFSLSHWGRPPVVVSMHQYKRDADAQVRRVHAASAHRDLGNDAAFAALIQELAAFGDGEAA